MTNGHVYLGGRPVENCEMQTIRSPVRMELSVTRDGCRALWSSNGQSVEYTFSKPVERPFPYFLVCSLHFSHCFEFTSINLHLLYDRLTVWDACIDYSQES